MCSEKSAPHEHGRNRAHAAVSKVAVIEVLSVTFHVCEVPVSCWERMMQANQAKKCKK